MGIVSFAAFYSASVIVPALRSSVAITSASAAVTAKTQTYFRSLSDADADDCVNNNASPEQLLGGMRFYKACAIIKQGNSNQTNQTNGPLLDKIAKITEKLAEHETTVDPAKEAEVIGCLVSYYMNRM
ncbi:MAG: hypothetical protein S4CHLAM27_12720 [Chlamydiia bacterium]|nr:hypothetical protein [Chlamydiia bacterium]